MDPSSRRSERTSGGESIRLTARPRLGEKSFDASNCSWFDAPMPRPPEHIETERLILRPWTLDDAPRLALAVRESLPELQRFMPWALGDVSDAAYEVVVAQMIADWESNTDYVYGVLDRRDDTTVLGGSGLHARAGPDELEVGYWVHSDHHRRGIALELSAALTDAGFAVGCRNLLLACDVANTASEGVIRKLGYRYAEEVDGAAGALETTGRHKRFAISEAEWMLVRPALTRPNGQARGLR